MDNKNFQLMLIICIVAIIICLFVWIIAAIGSMDLTDGCLYRYSTDNSGTITSSDKVTNTVIIKANANYTAEDTGASSESLTLSFDPAAYGKWSNSHFLVQSGQKIQVRIRGDVSLCQAYVPRYNLEKDSDTVNGNRIKIPRVENKAAAPIPMIFDAKLDEWRNIAEMYPNDLVVVAISPEKHSNVSTQVDILRDKTVTADCSEGRRTYDPICGRFSIWDDKYVSTCRWEPECYECNCRKVCKGLSIFGWCIAGYKTVCDWCGCYKDVLAPAPEPHQKDGFYTSPREEQIRTYFRDFVPDCRTRANYVLNEYQNEKYFWFSADTPTNIYYRIAPGPRPANYKQLGSDYTQADFISGDDSFLGNYKTINKYVFPGTDIQYLQYRFGDDDAVYGNNTGGYVLNVKQTKCRRKNGQAINDTFIARGLVDYAIAPIGVDPNDTSANVTFGSFIADADGNASMTVPGEKNGNVWLRIKNNPADYADSFGQYQVQFFGSITKGKFLADILEPLFESLKSKITGASETVFKNMTCYQGTGGSTGNCTNFFNYLRAILMLYIIYFGAMFLIGNIQINQMDFVIRIIKVALVAGLMNENTFNFFNTYIFKVVTNFSDEMIANISGYSLFTTGDPSNSAGSIRNPFQFLDAVLTKIFMSKTFGAQIMALIAMGLNGVIYFIIVMTALIFVIIAALRGIAIYIMAYVAVAVLIGLAPLFLSFILFDFTRGLFDNWVKFTIRYMIEPVIMLAGIIILCQLFTVFLDYVISYSVCWKCALPIKIPFPNLSGFSPAFLDVPLFCINWFAPWGHDTNTGQMGLNMTNMVVLLMIAICMKGYIDFSSKLVFAITGTTGPSATSMGSGMAKSIAETGLSKVGLDSDSRKEIKASARQRLNKAIQDSKEGKGANISKRVSGKGGGSDPSSGGAGGATGAASPPGGASSQVAGGPSGPGKGEAASPKANNATGGSVTNPASSWQAVQPSQEAKNQAKESAPRFGGHRSKSSTESSSGGGQSTSGGISGSNAAVDGGQPTLGGHRAAAAKGQSGAGIQAPAGAGGAAGREQASKEGQPGGKSPPTIGRHRSVEKDHESRAKQAEKAGGNKLSESEEKDASAKSSTDNNDMARKAGIGDRYKSMTEEQKAAAREKLKAARKKVGVKTKQKGDKE